jgi:hypothetical protein
MLHPEIMRFLADERIGRLQADARRPVAAQAPRSAAELVEVELRLCRTSDDLELARLAELEGRPLPFGRLVVAVVRGRIVAALPIAGGHALADPFAATEHIIPLLELRAGQLRAPEPRHGLLPRSAGFVRGLLHA